jgi:tetratricopeptide (TPR) repeat protein
VYTGITFIDREGVSLSKAIRIEPPDKLYSCLVEGNWLATPTVVARRECYEAVGEFDDRFRMAEDYDMWLRLTARYRFIGVAQPLARIRVHPGNTMANVDRLCADRLALVQKHFGCLEDPSKHAPDADRGYAFAFRAMALACVEAGQGNRGWAYLSRAAGLYPRLLSRPDTFYELVCGDQPRGYRGQAGLLDIKANGTEMLARLRELFAAHPNLGPYQHQAFGLAYLALAMLSDQAGKWGQARAYLLRAIAARPLFLRDATVLRRLLKLCAGRPIVAQLRRIRRRKAAL